jgi:hypothetical protein
MSELSAEAIIGLVALLVAIIPSIGLLVWRKFKHYMRSMHQTHHNTQDTLESGSIDTASLGIFENNDAEFGHMPQRLQPRAPIRSSTGVIREAVLG